MKKRNLERDILLAETGELSAAGVRRLERAIESMPEAAAFRHDLRRLRAAVKAVAQDEGPAPFVEANILAEATKPRGRASRRLTFPRPAIRLAACAAGLLVLISGWLTLAPRTPNALDPVGELQTILAMLDGEAMAFGAFPGVGAVDEERVRAVARQLLIMQGLASEDPALLEFELWESVPTA